MKKRFSIWFIAVVVVLVALIVFFARRPNNNPVSTTGKTNIVPIFSEQTPIEEIQRKPAATALLNDQTNASTIPEATAGLGQSKSEQMANLLSNYNDAPILFYGKLEDQFTDPVSAATIDFEIPYNTGHDVGVKRGQTVSDAAGLFTISGYTGERLSAVPKKPGYALASTNGGGIYSQLWPEEQRIHPDAGNPVIIKMWKLQGAEPLFGINEQFKLHYTNDPMHFDLLASKVVPMGGDLKVTVSREPGVISGNNRPAWSLRIEAVDGGLIESAGREPITYWAPAEDYQASSTISFSTNAWNGGFNRGFFVVSRGGRVYSKLGLTFNINEGPDDPMYIAFSGIANTNSSRNWEGDPNTFKSQ